MDHAFFTLRVYERVTEHRIKMEGGFAGSDVDAPPPAKRQGWEAGVAMPTVVSSANVRRQGTTREGHIARGDQRNQKGPTLDPARAYVRTSEAFAGRTSRVDLHVSRQEGNDRHVIKQKTHDGLGLERLRGGPPEPPDQRPPNESRRVDGARRRHKLGDDTFRTRRSTRKPSGRSTSTVEVRRNIGGSSRGVSVLGWRGPLSEAHTQLLTGC
jgi:hypothetical protein